MQLEAPNEPIVMNSEERAAVVRLHDWLTQIMQQTTQIAAQSSQWLLASLLAVNGGALVTVMGSDKLPPGALPISATGWTLGLIAALGVGTLTVRANTNSMKMLGDYISQINVALITGILEPFAWEEDVRTLNKARRGPIITGWLSAAFFVAGCMNAGIWVIFSN